MGYAVTKHACLAPKSIARIGAILGAEREQCRGRNIRQGQCGVAALWCRGTVRQTARLDASL